MKVKKRRQTRRTKRIRGSWRRRAQSRTICRRFSQRRLKLLV